MKDKKILITGVAGFIGSNLADFLIKEGYPVVGIDNLAYGVREQVPEGVEFHEADVRSRDIRPLFNGIDTVFHLAAKNTLLDCQKDPLETAEINVSGTVNVFEAAHISGVRKVVYAESSAVYEERAHGFYAVSKMCTNLFAKGFRESFGMRTIGLRYFNVYGPRQDYRRSIPPVMSTFIIKMLLGKPVIMFEGDGENRRDFIHVDDINRFHLQVIESDDADGKTLNLGTGTNHSVKEIFETIKGILGANPEVVAKPRLEGDPVVQGLADISETKKLGWEPKMKLEDGLRGMIEFIRKEIEKGNIK